MGAIRCADRDAQRVGGLKRCEERFGVVPACTDMLQVVVVNILQFFWFAMAVEVFANL